MLAYLHLAWFWLSQLGALWPYIVVTLAAYGLIYAWRKLSPASWSWLEAHVPFAAELDKGEEIAKNVLLSLPSVAIGAGIGALSSGLDPKATVLAALAGAFAPLLHHVRKALPFDPYKGAVGLAFLLFFSVSTAACGPRTAAHVPCDASDHAAQLDLATHAAVCRQRVQACGADQDCKNAVIDECDAYGDTRCAEAVK